MTDSEPTVDTHASDSAATLQAELAAQQQRIDALEQAVNAATAPSSASAMSSTSGPRAMSARSELDDAQEATQRHLAASASAARQSGRPSDVLSYLRMRRARS